MSREQDKQFFRNFVLVLGALAAFGFIAAGLGNIFSGLAERSERDTLQQRLARVGQVNTDSAAKLTAAMPAAAPAPVAAMAGSGDLGKDTYNTACAACHAAGVLNAPKFGDKAAWEPRIAQGKEVLYEHAIKGFLGMPAKGGNAALTDDAVKAAVDYLLAESGGEPRAAAEAAPASGSAAAAPAANADQPVAAAAPADAAAQGKQIYDTVCFVCHTTGVAGAPKVADKAAWEPRIAHGKEVIYKRAIEGYIGQVGVMPPKGGRADLTDDDVKAAVDYMLSTVQ